MARNSYASDYVISPKIGGGYLHIANGNYSVEIDPNHKAGNDKTKDGYLFCIRNKNKSENDVIMGVTKDGKGYFSGEIHAKSGEFIGDIKSGSTITCGDNFVVDEYGNITAKNIEITGGNIHITDANENKDYFYVSYESNDNTKHGHIEISPKKLSFEETNTSETNTTFFDLTPSLIQSHASRYGLFKLDSYDCICYGNGYSFSDVYNQLSNINSSLSNKLSTDVRIKNASWITENDVSYLALQVDNQIVFFKPYKYGFS